MGAALIAAAVTVEVASGGTMSALALRMGMMGGGMLMSGIAAAMQGGGVSMSQSVKNPAGTRQSIYGQTRTNGTVIYMSSIGHTINQVVAWASHPCESVDYIYADGRQVYFYGGATEGYCDGSKHTDPSGNVYSFRASSGNYKFAAWSTLGSYSGHWISQLGTGAAPPSNDSNINGDPNWDSTCTLNGICATYAAAVYDATIYSSIPQIKAAIKGKNDIFDPRLGPLNTDGTVNPAYCGWTDNAALVIADFLVNTDYGMAYTWDEIDIPQLIAAANICDTPIALADATVTNAFQAWQSNYAYVLGQTILDSNGRQQTVSGYTYMTSGTPTSGSGHPIWQVASGQYTTDHDIIWLSGAMGATTTEKQYTINGAVDWAESPGNTLTQMLDACAGRISIWNGKVQIFPGAWYGTTTSFGLGDIVGKVSFKKAKYRDICNAVRAKYICPSYPYNLVGYDKNHPASGIFDGQYQPQDAPEYAQDSLHGYASDANLAADGGVKLYQDKSYKFVTSCGQAQRLMKIYLLRSRQMWSGTIRVNAKGLQNVPNDVIKLTIPQYGWNNKLFEIVAVRHIPEISDNNPPVLYWEFDLVETDPSVYTWSIAEERTQVNSASPRLDEPRTNVVDITGLTLESDITTAVVSLDGIVSPRIKATWTEPFDSYTTSGGSIAVQFQKVGDTDWKTLGKLPGNVTQTYITAAEGVVAGQSYNVAVQPIHGGGAAGDWTVQTITVPDQLSNISLNIVSDSPEYIRTPAGGAPIVGAGDLGATPNANTTDAAINYGSVIAGGAALPGGVNSTYTYARWTGYLIPSVSGSYQIGCNFSGGCNLFIAQVPAIYMLNANATANPNPNTFIQYSSVTLQAGTPYQVVLEWAQGTNPAELQLLWLAPGAGSVCLIPAANLSTSWTSTSGNLSGKWWNGTSGLWYPTGANHIDFSSPTHIGKTQDNIPDGSNYHRVLGTYTNGNRPVINLADGIHVNVDGTHIPYGSGGTLDSLKPAEAGAEVTTGKPIDILADGVYKRSFQTHGLCNNYSVSGSRTGWGVGGSLTATTKDGNTITADGVTTSGNVAVWSDYIPVDPAQTYKVSLSISCTNTIGTRYFGMMAYDANKNVIAVDQFDIPSRTFNASTTNPYFWWGADAANTWRDIVAYIVGYNTPVSAVPAGRNAFLNFRLPSNTAYVQIRYLNYDNAGTTTTAFFYSPSMVSTDTVGDVDGLNDGGTYHRTIGTYVSAGRPVINLADGIHQNVNGSYIPYGSGGTLDSLKPAESGATLGASWGTNVSNQPQDLHNLILHPAFSTVTGSDSTWGQPTVAVTGQDFPVALKATTRDVNETGNQFPVVAGEKYFVSATFNSQNLVGHPSDGGSWNTRIGLLLYDKTSTPTWAAGASVAPGSNWTTVSGTVTIPAGYVTAVPWLQIDGSATSFTPSLYSLATNLYIGKYQPGADITAGNDLSVLVGRTADKLLYGNGMAVEALRPAEAGAEVTTGKDLSVLSGRTADKLNYVSGATVDSLKPAEAGADVTGANTSADTAAVSGTLASSVVGNLSGTHILTNPDFATLTGWSVYDNLTSGNVYLTLIADSAAPNTSGNKLQVAYVNNGAGISPGWGGFTCQVYPDSGVAQPNKYHRGSTLVWRVIANIPVGYTINFGGNPVGTGSVQTSLSSMAGTGTWTEYVWRLQIGNSGTFSTTGFVYLTGGSVAATWYVAVCEAIDITAPTQLYGSKVIYSSGNKMDDLEPLEMGAEKTTGKDLSVLVGRTADKLNYVSGATVDSLKPAEAGAEVTTGKSLDILSDGATYRRIKFVATDGTLHTSSVLNAQGSVAPTQPVAYSYTYTSNSITLTVPAQSLMRMDGTSLSIAYQTYTWSSLSASTTYFIYGYVDAVSGTLGFTNPNPPSTTASVVYATQAYYDGRVPIPAFSVTTTAVGLPAGGGTDTGGVCPEANVLVDVQGKGNVRAGDVVVGDYLRGKCFATGLDTYRKVIKVSSTSNHQWRVVNGYRVTPTEPVWFNDAWTPAYKVGQQNSFNGQRVDITLESDEYDEQNYYVVGEAAELLIHNAIIMSC